MAVIPPHANTKAFSGPNRTAFRASVVNATTINPPVSSAQISLHLSQLILLFFCSPTMRTQRGPLRARPSVTTNSPNPALYRAPIFSPACACFLSRPLHLSSLKFSGPPFILQHFARNVRTGGGGGGRRTHQKIANEIQRNNISPEEMGGAKGKTFFCDKGNLQ